MYMWYMWRVMWCNEVEFINKKTYWEPVRSNIWTYEPVRSNF